MDEWIDALDESGNLTGETVLKSEAHRRGIWHRCFHCWVFSREESGEVRLLIQRRSHQKETWPGELDVTVAGHLAAGETPLDGRRELEEEIGLSVAPDRLVPAFVRRVEVEITMLDRTPGTDREFHHVYLLMDSTPLDNFVLQTEEVDAILSITLPDAALMADGNEVSATEYRPGEPPGEVCVTVSEMVGQADYLSRILDVAHEKLSLT